MKPGIATHVIRLLHGRQRGLLALPLHDERVPVAAVDEIEGRPLGEGFFQRAASTVMAALETAEERAHRQITAWRSLAGGWVSDTAFDEEIAAIYAALSPGRDVTL